MSSMEGLASALSVTEEVKDEPVDIKIEPCDVELTVEVDEACSQPTRPAFQEPVPDPFGFSESPEAKPNVRFANTTVFPNYILPETAAKRDLQLANSRSVPQNQTSKLNDIIILDVANSYQPSRAVDSDDSDDLFPSNYKQTHVPKPVLSQAYPNIEVHSKAKTKRTYKTKTKKLAKKIVNEALKEKKEKKEIRFTMTWEEEMRYIYGSDSESEPEKFVWGRGKNKRRKDSDEEFSPEGGDSSVFTEDEESQASDDSTPVIPKISQLHLKIAEKKEKKKEKKKRHGKLHKCPDCDYSSTYIITYRAHRNMHKGIKPYRCYMEGCDFRTHSRISLRGHKTQVHSKRKYICELCDGQYKSLSTLTSHVRCTHPKEDAERPYKCSQCEFQTFRKPILIHHERTHTGDKPWKCTECSYASTQQINLQTHMRTHTGEKPYKCPHCDYAAAHNVTLKGHIKTSHPPTND